jgi:diphosphomevalonate decarboxylase
MKTVVRVQAPSNIAVIKYMGKTDASVNLPANPSLSLTLDSLCTMTELELTPSSRFELQWEGSSEMGGRPLRPLPLQDKDRPKMERHFRRVLEHFGAPVTGHWFIRTGNAFPAGAGIASSASGFAALTLAIAAAIGKQGAPRGELAALSRQGSGSSCRSFEGPWVQWDDADARAIDSTFDPLTDLVILIEESEKAVGSSEAHQRVRTSPNWKGRVERAKSRLTQIRSSLVEGDWKTFSSTCWDEAMDMHELFHTAEPAFSYWKPQTREVLAWLESIGAHRGDVKIGVTLDAGPNVHLLIPQRDEAFWLDKIEERFPKHQVLVDQQGSGARVLFRREMPA